MMKSQKILILGSKGMLGQALVQVFETKPYKVTAWDIDDVDVTDFGELATKIEHLAPDLILNAVAYNAVDVCETDETAYAKATLLNALVPEKLAQISHKVGSVLVHYSTDYVFDGSLETGYDEGALPQPLSRYGETKREGENAALESGAKAYIIRLSKLFGQPATSTLGKRSFFEVMLEQGRSTSEVQVVDSEKSCFTYAPDLAQASRELVEAQPPYGIYHLPNEGAATWYEGVVELYRLARLTTKVIPVASNAFPRPAQRPVASVLLNTKRPKLRHYREALAEFLA